MSVDDLRRAYIVRSDQLCNSGDGQLKFFRFGRKRMKESILDHSRACRGA